MTALLLTYGTPDLYLKRFPSNEMSPITTACDWATQNAAAWSSLSALLEWAWKDQDPDTGSDSAEEVIIHDTPSEGKMIQRVKNLQALMKEGLRVRKQGTMATRGRTVGFASNTQEAQFEDAVERACRELDAMMIGKNRSSRKVSA